MDLNNLNDGEAENNNYINNEEEEKEDEKNNFNKNGNSVQKADNSENLNEEQNEENYDLDIDNIDEDLYMQELYLRLAQMKQERKEAEANAKLLDNRLNLLKGEEKKAWKKIENTKKGQMINFNIYNIQFRIIK